jgi:hypothetical protein
MEISYRRAWNAILDHQPLPPGTTRIAAPPDLPKPVLDKGSGFFRPESTANGLGEIDLRRGLRQNAEMFTLKTNLAYLDRDLGVFLVPSGLDTDMASVPQFFTWLVPKTGTHLPAALIHDAFTPPEQKTYVGPDLTQAQADRIFRNAMDDLGTGTVRQWLVWTAVAVATEAKDALKCARQRDLVGCLRLLRLIAFVLPILILGVLATLDLLDLIDDVPWMGERSAPFELISGALFAILLPVLLSCVLCFWKSKLGVAAIILGAAIALFLHATIVIAGLLFLYNAVESLASASRHRGPWRAFLDGTAALIAYIVAILLLVLFALWLPIDRIDQMSLNWLHSIVDGIEDVIESIWDNGWLVLPLTLVLCLVPIILSRRTKAQQLPARTSTGKA